MKEKAKKTPKKSREIRSAFLDFFQERGHRLVPSSSLVPNNDPSLLFTNAGMAQFKDIFLGNAQSSFKRAVSCQRCLRAGGKHNDLDNVGFTSRHHTFFEMLGNFSFGDYSNRDAIAFAWEFLIEVLRLPPNKLWITIYDKDDESEDIWLREIGVDRARFSKLGEADNFWAMGAVGPCGPCTEIYYDHGETVAGDPPGLGEEGDRYVEIWNLVFMLYERDEHGETHHLPKPCVDTGMGLERITAVMQGTASNFETDLFESLSRRTAELLGVANDGDSSLKVIADHARACAFLLADGVFPGNEGRAYVLRKIIRRALRHGYKLGAREPFFYHVAEQVIKEMSSTYPELSQSQDFITRSLAAEEARFTTTLETGLKILADELPKLATEEIPGELAFKLFDTYGFPLDLTVDLAREKNLRVDFKGFETAMQKQRERARAASGFNDLSKVGNKLAAITSRFCGYQPRAAESRLVAILVDGKLVDSVSAGESAAIALDETQFYPESGGQLGDTGNLENARASFAVHDTQKQGDLILHSGEVKKGVLKVGETLIAKIDEKRRVALALNHSATHLLNAALRQILGKHIHQKGSLVAADRLRFDFSHDKSLSNTEKTAIETLVNEQIRKNSVVDIDFLPLERAIAKGALTLFDGKYGDVVRVLSMGDFSMELCGGTHVKRTGDIGIFKIVSDSAVANGIRRVEALTGEAAWRYLSAADSELKELTKLLKTDRSTVLEKTKQLLSERRDFTRRLGKEAAAKVLDLDSKLAGDAVDVNGVKVLTTHLPGIKRKELRLLLDRLKKVLGRAVVVLATTEDDTARLVIGVTKNITAAINAAELARFMAAEIGGNGGGRPDLAEAGGNNAYMLNSALSRTPGWVRERILSAGASIS